MSRNGTQKQWTILSLISWSESYLKEKGIESPRLTAELLLAGVLACDRVYLYTHFDQPLTKDELEEYKAVFLRRLKREPIQYIFNESEFYGRSFFIDQRVLIPRPETEHLIDTIIDFKKIAAQSTLTILDIGTGSGILAVTLLLEDPGASVYALDTSKKALEVAAINASRYGVREDICLIQVDILNNELPFKPGFIDIIVSNPPYISAHEWQHLPAEIRMYEPPEALTDRSDGYTFYRRIASLAGMLLKGGGAVFVEIGQGQAMEVENIFRMNGSVSIQSRKDYAGIIRVVGGVW
jgi:release factor glutamine methyltransferase